MSLYKPNITASLRHESLTREAIFLPESYFLSLFVVYEFKGIMRTSAEDRTSCFAMDLPTNWHSVNILALLVASWAGDSELSHAELQGRPLHSQSSCCTVWA